MTPSIYNEYSYTILVHNCTNTEQPQSTKTNTKHLSHISSGKSDHQHHHLLFANCLAQSEALLHGRTLEDIEQELMKKVGKMLFQQ